MWLLANLSSLIRSHHMSTFLLDKIILVNLAQLYHLVVQDNILNEGLSWWSSG